MAPLSHALAVLPLLCVPLLAADFHCTDCTPRQEKDETSLLQVKQDVVPGNDRSEKVSKGATSPVSLTETGASDSLYPGMLMPGGMGYAGVGGLGYPAVGGYGGFGGFPGMLGGYGYGVGEVMSPGLGVLPEVVRPELDKAFSGTANSALEYGITIPQGATHREAMSVIHKFATGQIKSIYQAGIRAAMHIPGWENVPGGSFGGEGLREWEAVIDAQGGSVQGLDGVYSRSANAVLNLALYLSVGTTRRQAIQQIHQFAQTNLKGIYLESLRFKLPPTGYPAPPSVVPPVVPPVVPVGTARRPAVSPLKSGQ